MVAMGAAHHAAQPMLARRAMLGSRALAANCTRDVVRRGWARRAVPRSLCSPGMRPGGRALAANCTRDTVCRGCNGCSAPCRAAYARQARDLGVARPSCKLHARRGVPRLGATRRAAQPMLARHATWGSRALAANCTRDAACRGWKQRTMPRSLCSPSTRPGGRAP
jgi:hypothetical protein